MSAASPEPPTPDAAPEGRIDADSGSSDPPRDSSPGEPSAAESTDAESTQAESTQAESSAAAHSASLATGDPSGAASETLNGEAQPVQTSQSPRKGPLSFLSGALTSGLLAWLCLGFSQKVVGYYALHPPHYEARVAQSIATALKTMIVGMSFLATFSFAFVGFGLFLVFLRSLLPARPETPV